MATEGASTTQRIEVTGAANITLDGVNISTGGGPALKIKDDAMFNVNITLANDSENTLTATASGCAGLQKNGNTYVGMLTITGSTGENAGKLTAIGGKDGAGIGGGVGGNGSAITISGGTVTATGGGPGAGIGGGAGGNGSAITISGGTVTATGGGFGAGIGGGASGNGSAITISGGTVTATGATGIGGGTSGSGTDITISGGKVTANGGYGGAGIGSSDDMDMGKHGDRITITGGHVIAYGGGCGAGIGGGGAGDGNNITITGGVVEAYGGKYLGTKAPAGIGGGFYGSAAGNSISGDAVVIATSGLEGVEAVPNCTIDNGIVFRGVGTNFDSTTGHATDFTWNGSEMNGNVSLTQDVEIPSGLTIPEQNTLAINTGKTLTVSDASTLKNEGTVTINGNLSCEGTGAVTTRTHFYLEDGTIYGTDDYYQTYLTAAGQQEYVNLPNPDATTLSKSSNDAGDFEYWYYLDASGNKIPINNTVDVLLNQHAFYEKREAVSYTITVPSTENGMVTSNKTEAEKDETVTLTVTPDEGYQLQEDSLKVVAGSTEIALTDKGDSTYTFSMPASNVAVSATFEPVPGPDPTDTISITFATAEGSWQGLHELTIEGEADQVIVTPQYPEAPAGKTCIGWFDEAGMQVISGQTTFSEVTGTVTARYAYTLGWHENATGWWYVYDLSNNYYINSWALIHGFWFYFNDAGYCLEYTWGYINGEWYFFGWGGYMQTGWQYLNHTWYFLDRYTGEMKVGWQKDGVWYYLNPETGAMYNNCWAYINGEWYGFNEGGSMTQGWSWSYAYNGWFYLQPDTGHMLYGWQCLGGHWYYFYDNGVMAANTRIGTYRLGADGIWK